jgi:thymidylate synthase (FAD)
MELKVLDHGYVRAIEDWGYGDAKIAEAGIIEAARQSTQGAFRGWDKDMKLLAFMYEHRHESPFEFAGLIIEVQAPIFIFREWHRHRTQSYNEMSARYTELPDLFYIPSIERLMAGKQSSKNKQGSEEGFTEAQAAKLQEDMTAACGYARLAYEWYLKEGMSRELARLVIPVNQYSRMRASANLRNWLAFLSLRLDPSAQYEIRQYAEAVSTIVESLFPRTHSLFTGDKKND